MKCTSCGAEVAENAVYCHKCGQRVDGADQPQDEPAQGGSSSAEPEGAAARLREMAGARDVSDPEDELWEGRYSPKDMVGAWAAAALATVVLVAVAIWLSLTYEGQALIIWGVLAAVVVLWWGYLGVVVLYRRLGVRYRLTSQRFFHEKGILRHVTDRIEVIDMDDISFEQSLFQRMVGVGTIHITSSDRSHPVLDVRGIENVKEVSALMDNARRQERMRRGLHIEAV